MDPIHQIPGLITDHGTTAIDFILFGLAGAALGALAHYIRCLNRPPLLCPRSGTLYLIGGAAGGLGVFLLAERLGWTAPHWDWILVAALGGAVGVGELASRYRDEPIKAILSVPATIYVLLNATASILALMLGRHFGLWQTPEEPVAWSQVLSAGLGAMVLLRSAVFRVRVGDQDVDVGPSSFLQSVIDAADRAVDRLRAQERAWAVMRVMNGVSSKKAITILPSYISALMQNMNKDEQGDFDEKVKTLLNDQQSDQVKAMMLGLLAMRYTGERVLSAAVQSLNAEIQPAAGETSAAAAQAAVAARDTESAAQGVVVAMDQVMEATQTANRASEVGPIAEKASEMATVAASAAKATSEQTRKTVEAALTTMEKVSEATQPAARASGVVLNPRRSARNGDGRRSRSERAPDRTDRPAQAA